MKKCVVGLVVMLSAAVAFADWTYTASSATAGSLTDGNWTLTSSNSKNSKKLTITGVSSVTDNTELDLSGAVANAGGTAYTIVTVSGLNTTANKATLAKVILPDTVTTISSAAFKECTALTEVTLSSALTTLGSGAFQGCTALTKVTPFLPETVTTIGTYAFKNCPIDIDVFSLGLNHAVAISTTGGESSSSAFIGVQMKKLVLGPYVTSVKGWQFQDCTALTNVVFQGDVTSLGAGAFQGCTSLKTVTPFLPDVLNYLGRDAFRSDPIEGDLRLAMGGGSLGMGYSGGNADSYAFSGSKVTSLECGTGVTLIRANLLPNVTTLTNVIFHGDITGIGMYAFNGCTSLKTVTPLLPKTLSSLGIYAFGSCPLEGVLRLGETCAVAFGGTGGQSMNYAFKSTHLTDFIAGTNLTTVQAGLFYGSTMLTNVNLSAATNLTSVGYQAFYGCSSLTNVTFADLKPTFGTDAFTKTAADLCGRFQYPKKSATWIDYINSFGANFHEWTAATTAESNAYYQAFSDGPEPRGYATVNSRKKWFVPLSDAEKGQVDLTMAGDPYDMGTSVPEYGNRGSVTPPVACSITQYGENDDIAYESCGYRINKMGAITWEEVLMVPGVRSFSFDPGEEGEFQVEWLWKPAAYTLHCAPIDPSVGSVAISGTVLDAPTLAGTYYVSNTVVTLTVTSNGLPFKRWYGDVPAGHETDTTIQITMDAIKNVGAYFETPWTYDSSAKTVSDGYWTFNVSGGSTALTLSSIKTKPYGVAILDLTKQTDGHAVTSIADALFKYNKQIEEVRLPDGLTSIGASAFQECTNLKVVTPLLPESLTWIGTHAFSDSPVTGDVVYGKNHAVTFAHSGGNDESHTFNGTKITSVTAGPYVKFIPGYQFANCSELTYATFEGPITAFNRGAFNNCNKLVHVTPLLPDTVSFVGSYAFNQCPIEGVLTLGTKTNVAFGVEGGNDESYAFNCSHLSEFVLGSCVKSLPGSFIKNTATLTNIVFHNELRSIGYLAFNSCTSLKKVTPLMPESLHYLGYSAFAGCPIEGRLVLGTKTNLTYSTSGGDYQNSAFKNSKITEAYFGPCLTTIPGGLMYGCSVLTNVYIEGRPGFGKTIFTGGYANMRYFLDRRNADWDAWLADTANANPWTNLTAAAQGVYTNAFGAGAKLPKARVVKSNAPFLQNAWLFRFTPAGGFSVIMR